MRINKIIPLALVIVILGNNIVLGQETSDIGSHSGAQYYYDDYENLENYSSNTRDVNGVPTQERQPVFEQDFLNAKKTIETYGMGFWKRRKLAKKRKEKMTQEEERAQKLSPLNPSPYALFSLPIDVKQNGNVIPAGFYLLEYKNVEDKEVVLLRQRDQIYASITPEEVNKQDHKQKESTACIKEITDNIMTIELNTPYSKIKFKLNKNLN